jgi:hypothetical protein
MEAKLAAAKAYLGEVWVLHPRYDPQKHPHHTTKRPCVLTHVETAARAAGRI